jgi:hypothetical protein
MREIRAEEGCRCRFVVLCDGLGEKVVVRGGRERTEVMGGGGKVDNSIFL